MNIPGYAQLTDGERALIEWQYGIAGDFKKGLWQAIAHADEGNLQRLRTGFPIEVDAFLRFSRESGYWETVVKKAGGDVEAGY